MSTRPAEETPDESDGDEQPPEAAAPATLEALQAAGDADGLMALAKAYRSGTAGQAKDLAKCLACYRAAAELGSPEGSYSAALFSLSGGVVPQDLKAGAAGLRVAADAGYVPAKVYLANLYELGVHYAADTEKADVWYRNAARAAGIEDDPSSPEYARAMADLGCARFALAIAGAPETSNEDRERYLRKAKAYGYQLKLRAERASGSLDEGAGSLAPAPPAALSRSPSPPPRPTKDDGKTGEAAKEPSHPTERAAKERSKKGLLQAKEAEEKPAPAAGPKRAPVGHALWAFLFETLFVGGSVGAGMLARLGALELIARGAPVPVVGSRVDLIVPLFVAVLGVVPAFLMYKAGTVARAIALGLVAGGAGFALWEAHQARLLLGAEAQALAFGVAGFLATLLVFGLLGGVKPPKRPMRRIVS